MHDIGILGVGEIFSVWIQLDSSFVLMSHLGIECLCLEPEDVTGLDAENI